MKTTATLIGIDLGKHTFHAHAQDKQGHFVFRKLFTRKKLIEFLSNYPAVTVAMEACAGAHWLSRRLSELGHTVKLIAPQYVKPFVKGNKHDFADAQAICEAASRPSMSFVAVKTESQQTLAMLHRLRESRVSERTLTMNQIQAFLLEFGISFPVGHAKMRQLLAHLVEMKIPPALQALLEKQHAYYLALCEQIQALEKDIAMLLAQDENAQRLLAVPGIGPITASLIAAEAGDAKQYRKGHDFAASLGLVPRQYSTGGKATLQGISKRGNKLLRSLLVQGARAVLLRLPKRQDSLGDWLRQLLQRRHANVVACALANKMARIVWAILTKGETYHVPMAESVPQVA